MKRFFLAFGAFLKKFAWAIMLFIAFLFGITMLSGHVGWAAVVTAIVILVILGVLILLFWIFRAQWHALVSLLTLLVVIGIFTGFLNGWWNLAVNNLTVKTAKIDNSIVGNEQVENQGVNNQTVENQSVNNQTVQNQTVENSTVKNQTVDKQHVNDQTVDKQTVKDQYVEKQTITKKPGNTTTNTPTVTNPPVVEPKVPTPTNPPAVPQVPTPTNPPIIAPQVPTENPVTPTITPSANIKFAQHVNGATDIFASVTLNQVMSVNITSNFPYTITKISGTVYHIKMTVPEGSSGVAVVNVSMNDYNRSYTFSNHMNY